MGQQLRADDGGLVAVLGKKHAAGVGRFEGIAVDQNQPQVPVQSSQKNRCVSPNKNDINRILKMREMGSSPKYIA